MDKFNSAKKIYDYIKEETDPQLRNARLMEINDYYITNAYKEEGQKIFDDRLTAIYDLIMDGENINPVWHYAISTHIKNTDVPTKYIDKLLPLGLTTEHAYIPLQAALYNIKKRNGNKELIETMKATAILVFNPSFIYIINNFISDVFTSNPEEQIELLVDMYKQKDDSVVTRYIEALTKGNVVIPNIISRITKYLRYENRDFENAMHENVFLDDLISVSSRLNEKQTEVLMSEKELLLDFFGLEQFCNYLYQSEIDLKIMREFPPTYASPEKAVFSVKSNSLILDNFSKFYDSNSKENSVKIVNFISTLKSTYKKSLSKKDAVLSNVDELKKIIRVIQIYGNALGDYEIYLTPKIRHEINEKNITLPNNIADIDIEASDLENYGGYLTYELFLKEFVDYVDKDWLKDLFDNRNAVRKDRNLRKIAKLFR